VNVVRLSILVVGLLLVLVEDVADQDVVAG